MIHNESLIHIVRVDFFPPSGDLETLNRSSEVTRFPRRSASEQIRPRSQSTDNEDHKKLRKARGAHVVIGENNVDFPSSPVSSPGGSPAKHVHVSAYFIRCSTL